MLRAEGLCRSFGAIAATRDVSLSVPAGQRHAIIGPNGAGKTTLFNLLTGELRPAAGCIYLDQRDVTTYSPDRRVRLGLARSFQRNNVFEDLSVRENLLLAAIACSGAGRVFWRRARGEPRLLETCEQVATKIGLAEHLDARVGELSYGSVRQLEIGLALATAPRVLLLDEPTSGMGPLETGRMLELVRGLPRELAIVIIEHDMDVVFGIADRITVLNYGEVLLEGTPQEVRASEVVRDTYLGARP